MQGEIRIMQTAYIRTYAGNILIVCCVVLNIYVFTLKKVVKMSVLKLSSLNIFRLEVQELQHRATKLHRRNYLFCHAVNCLFFHFRVSLCLKQQFCNVRMPLLCCNVEGSSLILCEVTCILTATVKLQHKHTSVHILLSHVKYQGM